MGEEDGDSEDDSVHEVDLADNQLRQAEEKLVPPTPATRQVKSASKLSFSSRLIDDGSVSRRKIGNPWTGPLPKPRRSPLCTFRDVLALATNGNVSDNSAVIKLQFGDQGQSPISQDRSWRQPSPAGSRERLDLLLDLASMEEFPNLKSNSNSNPQSRRGPPTGWVRTRIETNTKYTPATGLVTLFARTGTRRANPNSAHT
jgi:hypothetical protein